MVLLAPLMFSAWRIFRKTRWLRPHELDLNWEAELLAAYEEYEEEQPTGL
jgi:amino acid transporter